MNDTGRNGAVGDKRSIVGALIRNGVTLLGRAAPTTVRVAPESEFRGKAPRRRFTAAYKQRILEEAGRCAPGALGALLRREGLTSSHLTRWRRAAGGLAGEGKRGAKLEDPQAFQRRLAELERENRKLRQQLEQTETIISIEDKLSRLLEPDPPSPDEC